MRRNSVTKLLSCPILIHKDENTTIILEISTRNHFIGKIITEGEYDQFGETPKVGSILINKKVIEEFKDKMSEEDWEKLRMLSLWSLIKEL